MGVKLVTKELQGYRINGLIFPVVTFYMLKVIDNNFYNIVENVSSNYFKNIAKVKVIELYPRA